MKATEEERARAARELLRRAGLHPMPDPRPDDDTMLRAMLDVFRADHSLADLLVYGRSAR